MTRTVGDWRQAEISISTPDGLPAAGTVALTVVRGDNSTASVPMTAGLPTATATPWTSDPYELTKAGRWIEKFTVTGDGKGVEDQVFFVLPRAGTAPTGELVYATTEDYANAIQEAPPSDVDLDRAMAAATREVRAALVTAVYAVDSVTSLPTDAAVAAAIRDAVCEQTRWQIENDDPYALGSQAIQNASIGSLTLGRGAAGSVADAPGRRSPQALAILRAAGLTGHAPQGDVLWWSV